MGYFVRWFAAAAADRLYYELRAYELDSPAQKAEFHTYLNDVMIPAYNRMGVEPVGVLEPLEGVSPVYVLLPHPSLESIAGSAVNLLSDDTFVENGADYLARTKAKPLYTSYTTSILHAFEGMPGLEHPSTADSRVFQLRIYESPTIKAGQKKIEMFHKGELDIFRRVGLAPVFFGEAISGPSMPNLTYMLGFDDEAAMKAAWKKFGPDPQWQELRAIPEYGDDVLIRNITNIVLKPAKVSQF